MQSGAVKKRHSGLDAPNNASRSDKRLAKQPKSGSPESPLAAKAVSKSELSKLASRNELFVAMGLYLFVVVLFAAGRKRGSASS